MCAESLTVNFQHKATKNKAKWFFSPMYRPPTPKANT